MTSDAFPKWSHRAVRVGRGEVCVAGMAKGAGMICPHMATMLAFV
jgi:glutamate N-acetyltransferase/amino-acid N-acetyltransferase